MAGSFWRMFGLASAVPGYQTRDAFGGVSAMRRPSQRYGGTVACGDAPQCV
jgi:hypothetical protein